MKIRINTSPLANLFQQKHYISWLLYGLSTLLILLLQTAPRFFPSLLGVRPAPLIGFVICVAILGGTRTGVTVGVLAGLLCGIYSHHLFGFDALVFMLLGLIAGLLVEWFLRANFYTALLLCAGGILSYSLLEWLFCYAVLGRVDLAAILFKFILPSGLYTFALTPLVYWFSLVLARFVRRCVNN